MLIPAAVARLGERTHGVWTLQEALLAGLSRDYVRRRLRSGEWRQVHPRVYVDAGVVLDPLGRAAAAVAACGDDAVAAARTAARVWSLPLVDDEDPVLQRHELALDHCIVPRRIGRHGVLTAHRWQFTESDLTSVQGVAVTTPLRTLADLAIVLRPDALLCAVDAALHRHLVTGQELSALVADRVGRPGGPALLMAVAQADARTESPLETLTRIVVSGGEMPAWQLQLPVRDRWGRVVARLDLGSERHRLGVEADGAGPHSLLRQRYRDRVRDSHLDEGGWRVERATWWDARVEQVALRARVTAALRRRAP